MDPLSHVGSRKVIAVVRLPSTEGLLEAARAVLDGGLDVLELTWNTPGAPQGLTRLTETYGREMLLGAGTILNLKMAGQARDAGAKFIVTPTPNPEIIEFCLEEGITPIPGAFSPAEVWDCWTRGAPMVKLFPSGPVGPGHLKAIHGPFPEVRLVPTGGIGIEDVDDFLAAGAYAVGLTSITPPQDVERADWASITQRARRVVELAGVPA